MRILCLLLLGMSVALAGDKTDELVDRLFHNDPEVRASARTELAKLGPDALKDVLRRIEERQAGPSVLQVYDLRDFKVLKKWWPIVKGRMKLVGGDADVTFDDERSTAVVKAKAAIHKKLAKELESMRSRMGTLIDFEARILRFKKDVRLPARMPVAKLGAWLEKSGADVVHSPRLMTYNGQRASIQVVNQRSYVSDFDVESNEKGVVVDPVVNVVSGGIEIELRAVAMDDGVVRLALDAKLTTIDREMPTLHLPLPVGPGVDVQFPVGTSHGVRRVLNCKQGEANFVRVDGSTWIVLAAKVVELDEIRKNAPKAVPGGNQRRGSAIAPRDGKKEK